MTAVIVMAMSAMTSTSHLATVKVISITLILSGEDEEIIQAGQQKQQTLNQNWSEVGQRTNLFSFVESETSPIFELEENMEAISFFHLFLNDDILEHMVTETNRNVHQKIKEGLTANS